MSQRIDSSGYLYHWVRANPFSKGKKFTNLEKAYATFLGILCDGFIKNGDPKITGGEKCICFTESPEYFHKWDQSRYQPFGFKFYKKNMYGNGARPVFYCDISEEKLLHSSHKWRFAPHNPLLKTESIPFGLDYTWEREWRIRSQSINLQDAVAIIVPNQHFAIRLEDDVEKILTENEIYWIGGSLDSRDQSEYKKYFEDVYEKIEFPKGFDEVA